MVILTQPAALSLSGNIEKIRISTSEDISFVLSKGNKEILSAVYTPGVDHQISIDIRDIVESQLSFTLKDQKTAYVQTSIFADFIAKVNDQTINFRVIRSGVDRLAATAVNFVTANFLTWQPQIKRVTYYTPEFLTYYATIACNLKVKAYFTDKEGKVTTEEKLMCSMLAGNAYTIPVQYAVICELYNSKLPSFYDVWVENTSSNRLTYIQRYVADSLITEEEQWILFENSLGGIDTFRAYGQSEFTGNHTHNIAEIDDISQEYRVDTERTFQKSTGYLDKNQRKWLLDFFPAQVKYIYLGNYLRSIVVTEDDTAYTDKELPSEYKFTYKYADARPYLNLPRAAQLPNELNIYVPSLGSFTIPPRLVEFPSQPLSEGVLVPVQNPYSEKWATITAGSILNFIINSIASNYDGGGGLGHIHPNLELLNALSFLDGYLLVNGEKIKAAYADELSPNSPIFTQFLSRIKNDSTDYLLSLLGGTVIKKQAKFGEFLTGVSGGYINEKGEMEMDSGVFRKRIFVPEIAYNRTTYFKGRMVNSPGGGCTVLSYVDNGNGTYTITPDLTDADGLSQFVDDILTTYFVTKNAAGKLNGFEEMKFRVTEADYAAKKFTVISRPGYNWKPAEQMVLAHTGNFTDPKRQTYILFDSINGNNCITFFDHANTWDPEPAQMPSWFGKKKGMSIAGIDCDNYSAVLQNILMTGLIFQIDEITGSTVRVPIDFPSWEPGRKYAYYSRVPHNGSTWLCVNEKGTTSEPSLTNPDWLVSAAKGEKGDPGISVVGGGHWESSKTPYEANTMVSLANSVFLSKVKTSNPPIKIARFKNGNFRKKKDGGYILAGKSADWTVHEDWEMLLDGRELKGESITFLGEFASHPSNPKEGDSYRNTADNCTYIYRNGLWMVMVKDGTDGKDGKGYEWIYTRTNIIGLAPDKPDSKQQDDYVPEGWTDDFLGVDADHQVEWACKRVKRDGVWSEFSDPAPVHRWSKDGESNVMADLDNEMVSVALTSTGVTTTAQSWTTHVSMWYGTEKLTLETLTVSTPAGFTASTSKATGAVAISVAAGKSVPEQNTVTITLAAMKNGQLYTRELTFKITGVRGGADGAAAVIYSLVTSVTSVKKDKNGNYSVASVSCKRMKTVGAVTTATTDGELKYSRDGAAEVTIGDNVVVSSGNFTKSLKFVFYVGGQVVDIETIPMLFDGGDGADGDSIVSGGSWESSKTPYKKNRVVSFAGGSYLSKVETSNPPIAIARFKNGSYRRKKDGRYILAGRSANRSVHADWQEMVAPVDPSASYWLDSPVSTINFTSTGTPSPSAFLVTCKQNVGGNVSTCNSLYLAARKYNGSWLAHVGATQSSQISVPATAGYTQFAVRAYKSASDANSWNDNYVAEKGIGVATDGKPGDKGDPGATGAFPRDRGIFGTNDGLGAYVWNPSYRDKVIHLFNGEYYVFHVRNYGASVTAAPSSANGDTNWEGVNKLNNIATDTAYIDKAIIAGFSYAKKAGKNAGVLKSQQLIDGEPATSIDGETGEIITQTLHVRGNSTFDGYIKNSCVEAHLSRNTKSGVGRYIVDKDFKLFSCSVNTPSVGIYSETFILPTDLSLIGTIVNITNLCFPPYSRNVASIRNTTIARPGGSFQKDNVIHGYESGTDEIYDTSDITTLVFINGYVELMGIPEYDDNGNLKSCGWMIRQFKAINHSVVYA